MPRKTRSQLMVILLVTGMFALVDICAAKELLFPEISALALGFWVMSEPPWACSGFAMWASPSVAALTGVLLLRYVPAPLLMLIGGAFILVVLQLRLLRSSVFPSISAAILPLLTHTTSWLYPLSVSLLMAVIFLGRSALNRYAEPPLPASPAAVLSLDKAGRKRRSEVAGWGKLLLGVLAVAAVAQRFQCLFMVAPPLIVAFVEITRPEQKLRDRPVHILLLLVLSASSGAGWLYLVDTLWQGPLWLFAGLSLLSVFVLYEILQVAFPPAAAIALLPALVPDGGVWLYPLHVLMGSTLFVAMATCCCRETGPVAAEER